ncbi:MAG: hypothetical protein ACLP8Y_03760 [Thermoplasmata archaeon]
MTDSKPSSAPIASAEPQTPPSGRSTGPPSPVEGRARAFRNGQTQRKSQERERVGVLLVVAIIVLGVYVITSARPFSPSNNPNPNPGPPITVLLGTPTVVSVPCSAGGSAYAENIPITSISAPIVTGDVNARVNEIWDGDDIGDPNVVANATPSNLCAGSAPDASTLWYGVLVAPNGTNLLTYTATHAWVSVSNGLPNIGIENGSSFVLVSYKSFSGAGYGFLLFGYANGSLIRATIPL